MKIGLYNLEPKIVNTALMQVSQYHKDKGDEVEMYNQIFKSTYDKVYAFSIFDYTDKGYVSKEMVKGGTGFDITSKLDEEIEKCNYDWSMYPKCDHSIIWFSRGCIRTCPFCVVPDKEGVIHSVEPKNLNPNGKYIKIHDNNFFANPKWREAVKQLKEWGQPVEFECGIDIRILKKPHVEALNSLKQEKQIKLAWDNPKEDLSIKFKEAIAYGLKPYKLMCFVLIGYWSTPEEDLHRVETLRKLKIDPFVMPHNKKDRYQKDFARWVNHKAIYRTVKWEDYKKNPARYDKEQTLIPDCDKACINGGKDGRTKEFMDRSKNKR